MPRKTLSAARWTWGFPPVEPRQARILILGTLPGEESIRRHQYYAHPRNSFWPIMSQLVGAGPDLPYAVRLRKLKAAGIMLWDVLQAASRSGSADANIHPRRRRPNDISGLLQRHPELRLIAFNGGPAETLFRRHIAPHCRQALTRLALCRLPSTSPAHASRAYHQKLACWRQALGPYLPARAPDPTAPLPAAPDNGPQPAPAAVNFSPYDLL